MFSSSMRRDQDSEPSDVQADDCRGINAEVAFVYGVERHLQGIPDIA